MKLTASELLKMKIIDEIITEPIGGAHTNANEAARQLRRAVLQSLAELQSLSEKKLLSQRYKKFRKMGEYSSHFRVAIGREVNALQSLVATGVRRIARRGRQRYEESHPDAVSELSDQ